MLNFRRWAIAFVFLAPIAIGIAAYIGLILDGTLPPPKLEVIAQTVLPMASGSVAIAIGAVALVVIICAGIAPIIYAMRSGDVLTVLISLAMTTAALAVFFTARSAIQEILAVLIYLANMVLSATVYAAHYLSRPQ